MPVLPRPLRIRVRTTASVVAVGLAALSFAVAGPSTRASAAPAAATCKSYVYGSGGSGTCVKDIQIMLNGLTSHQNHKDSIGWRSSCYAPALADTYLTTDGSYGPLTKAKVQQLQRYACISTDGVVGTQTWDAMCDLLSNYDAAADYESSYMIAARTAANAAGCDID